MLRPKERASARSWKRPGMSKHSKEKGQMVYITYASLDDQSLVTDWKLVMKKGLEIWGQEKNESIGYH